MSLDKGQISADLDKALSAIASANDLDSLKQIKIDYIGDKSALAKANQSLASLDPGQRAEFGKLIGSARSEVNQAFELKSAQLSKQRDSQVLLTEKVDVTLPGRRTLKGGLHPLTILTNEISDLFIGLGYNVAEGPELESGWLNFDALNIPADHPARTMQDTFFIEPVESRFNDPVESAFGRGVSVVGSGTALKLPRSRVLNKRGIASRRSSNDQPRGADNDSECF